MPTPSSGPISMADINANFGRGTNLNAYRNTIWYQPGSLNFGYFNSGSINMSDFYNKQGSDPAGSGQVDYGPGTHYFSVPLFRNFLIVEVWGGGGGGGPYSSGVYAGSGSETRVYMPNGEQLAGGGGQGGQGSSTDRFGGVRFGVGGVGGGAGGGNQANLGGQTGGTGDNGFGGFSPNGGGTIGATPYAAYNTTGLNGNYPGGGGSGFNFYAIRGSGAFDFYASSGGGGGGGYARSQWGGGAFYTQTVTVVVGSGGGGGSSVGAGGLCRIRWG